MLRLQVAILMCGAMLLGCPTEETQDFEDAGQTNDDETSATLLSGTVTRYHYAFNLETAIGRSNLTLDVNPPGGNCLDIACALPVSEVQWNTASASRTDTSQGMLRACGSNVNAGEPLQLSAQVTVPERRFLGNVGFSRLRDMQGGTFSYLLSWIEGCSYFGPCDSAPHRLSQFYFEVTHPEGTTVLCPGTLTAGPTLTRCELSGTRAPIYSAFAIAADPLWVRTPYTSVDDVQFVFYEVPGGQLAASLDKESFVEFFRWLTTLLGPFPYGKEFRFAGAPTAWAGFEHPANVLLHERLPDLGLPYANPVLHVVMHEVVHQWAGDRTTFTGTLDVFWKEAIAEYISYVFEDEHRPPGEALRTRMEWDRSSILPTCYPRPTDIFPPPLEVILYNAYGTGSMVLLQLERLLSRPVVLRGIQDFLSAPGARSVQDLRVSMERASGQELGPYFDAWVFGSGEPTWPTFLATSEQVGDSVKVTLTQESSTGRLYGCAVDVLVRGATQSAKVTLNFGVAPSQAMTQVTIPFSEPVESLSVDPDHSVMGFDRRWQEAPIRPMQRAPIWIF